MASKKKEKGFRLRTSVSVHVIGAVIVLLIVFGLATSIVSVLSFTEAYKKAYGTSTYHMADTAALLVNGDHLEAYLDGEYADEFAEIQGRLDKYCEKMHVSLLYVIKVDTGDYGHFVSIFNSVNNEVDNTTYSPWELGHQRDTTNQEYAEKYENLYSQESAYETVYRLNTTGGLHPHITTLVPVKKSNGSVAGLLCVQRPARELSEARTPYLIRIALLTVLLAAVSGVLTAFYLRKQFVKPIQKISAEAARFAAENTLGEPLGAISKSREISNLAFSIDTMEKDMVTYIDNLTAATAEKERIGAELSLASTIQENSVPNKFPPFPDRTEFDIYAAMDPAREVGGDFYNFFFIDEDHLALVIGDVSGKGIPGSLFMMVTNILVTDRAKMGGTPAEILSFVNENLCEHNEAEMFVTVWLGILEVSTGKLVAANAGHEYPAMKKPGGQFELVKDKHGFVVAGMPGVPYKDYELTLEPGSVLFLYTDGVPESTDASNALFGTDRMLAALNAQADATPEELLKNIQAAVDGFVKEAEQFDDLTMLCIAYKGQTGDKNHE